MPNKVASIESVVGFIIVDFLPLVVLREMESRTMGVDGFRLGADDHDSVKSSDAGEREKTPVPHWTAKQRSHRLPELSPP